MEGSGRHGAVMEESGEHHPSDIATLSQHEQEQKKEALSQEQLFETFEMFDHPEDYTNDRFEKAEQKLTEFYKAAFSHFKPEHIRKDEEEYGQEVKRYNRKKDSDPNLKEPSPYKSPEDYLSSFWPSVYNMKAGGAVSELIDEGFHALRERVPKEERAEFDTTFNEVKAHLSLLLMTKSELRSRREKGENAIHPDSPLSAEAIRNLDVTFFHFLGNQIRHETKAQQLSPAQLLERGYTPREAIVSAKWFQMAKDLLESGEEDPQQAFEAGIQTDYPTAPDPLVQNLAMLHRSAEYLENEATLMKNKDPESIGIDPADIHLTPQRKVERLVHTLSHALYEDTDLEPASTREKTAAFRRHTLPEVFTHLLMSREAADPEERGLHFRKGVLRFADEYELFSQEALQGTSLQSLGSFEAKRQTAEMAAQSLLNTVYRLVPARKIDQEQVTNYIRVQIELADLEHVSQQVASLGIAFAREQFGALEAQLEEGKREVQGWREERFEQAKKDQEIRKAIGSLSTRPSERLQKIDEQKPHEALQRLEETKQEIQKREESARMTTSFFQSEWDAFQKRRQDLVVLKGVIKDKLLAG